MRTFTTSKGRLEKDLVEILEVYLTKIINVVADISFLQPYTKQCNTIQGLQVGNQALLLQVRHIAHHIATSCAPNDLSHFYLFLRHFSCLEEPVVRLERAVNDITTKQGQ